MHSNLILFQGHKIQQIQYKKLDLGFNEIKQTMKSSIFAALVGLGTAGGAYKAGNYQGAQEVGYSKSTTTYTATGNSAGGDSVKTFLPVVAVGGGNAVLTGVSDLAATSLGGSFAGGAGGNGAASIGGGIGTGNVLITSTTTGQSNIYSGKVITDGNFPKANLNSQLGSDAYAVNNLAVANGVINTAVSQTNTGANLNLKNLFTKLPNVAAVDNLILSSDSVSLLKLIQTVGADTTLPCDQRIAYLLQLNGRVKAAIEKKNYAFDQLKIVIDTANAEIIRLQAQIDQNNKDIDALGLDGLNIKLNQLLITLQTAYANYNKLDSQIPVLQAQISGSQKQIDILNKNSDNQRNAINNNKLKLNDIINQINALEAQLKLLLDKQAAIQASIDRALATIATNDQSIVTIKANIVKLQAQLAGLNDQADNFNTQTQDLQVKVQRLRTQISVSDAKKTRYLNQIAGYRDRIDIQTKLTVSADLPKLNAMIDNLKRIIPTIQSEIDRHYYYCYGDGKVQVQTVGGIVVYVVRGDAFGNYLRNLYGRNVVLPAVNGDVLFNRVDIFDSAWTGAFGYPFGSASLGGNDLAFGGSFGCTNPGSISSGSGTITAIGADFIECANGSSKTRFNLGSCSRLQSTRKLPSIGQKFYWSGVPANKGFNVYAASCLD